MYIYGQSLAWQSSVKLFSLYLRVPRFHPSTLKGSMIVFPSRDVVLFEGEL